MSDEPGAQRSECRTPGERDGAWYWDRFYHPTPARHYRTTVRDLTESGQRPDTLVPPPAQFTQLEELKSAEVQHPFSVHDNQRLLDHTSESLTGRHRKARPCCVRPLHQTSDPDAFVNTADMPTSCQRLQTSSKDSYQGAAPDTCDASTRRRLYARQAPCPFATGDCSHSPPDVRRMEPASTAPTAAAE